MNIAIPSSSNPNIAEELFREALNMLPELDPTKNCLLDEFAQCMSADHIMLVLEKRITMLKNFRNDRWAKLREKLKPVVEVALLVTKVIGNSAQSIVRFYPLLSWGVYITLLLIGHPWRDSHFHGLQSSVSCECSRRSTPSLT